MFSNTTSQCFFTVDYLSGDNNASGSPLRNRLSDEEDRTVLRSDDLINMGLAKDFRLRELPHPYLDSDIGNTPPPEEHFWRKNGDFIPL